MKILSKCNVKTKPFSTTLLFDKNFLSKQKLFNITLKKLLHVNTKLLAWRYFFVLCLFIKNPNEYIICILGPKLWMTFHLLLKLDLHKVFLRHSDYLPKKILLVTCCNSKKRSPNWYDSALVALGFLFPTFD